MLLLDQAMSLIKTIKEYPAKKSSNKHAFVLCGFGGSIWQLKRLITVLSRQGYHVTALDFSESVLSKGDATLLPKLVDDTVTLLEAKRQAIGKPVLLVGISLGALLSLNILRRSKLFDRAVMITGGDIVKVAQRIYGPSVWPQSYDELARQWQQVNMYTNPSLLQGKSMLMVLPKRDKLIDPQDVYAEVKMQRAAGNNVQLTERRLFGHVGTIIEEAVLLPHRTRGYIKKVSG